MDELNRVRPPNFRWILPGELAGCGRPSRPEHVAWMADEGVRAIVSTIPLWEDVEEIIQLRGIERLQLPIDDFGIPSDDQVRRFFEFTEAQLRGGKPVLVHCAAGIGRTGTLCALWLVRNGASAREALDRVGVESPPQAALLKRWEDMRLAES